MFLVAAQPEAISERGTALRYRFNVRRGSTLRLVLDVRPSE